MASITFQGNPVTTCGQLPKTGSKAPGFTLTGGDLSDHSLSQFSGKKVIINIVPSLDTGVCATSAKKFNASVARLEHVVLLNISADLPFAQSRFCESEKLSNITTLSTFRAPEFGTAYGVTITDGPLKGLLSRAVVILNEEGTIIHTEQVPEIAQEPNYDEALAAVE